MTAPREAPELFVRRSSGLVRAIGLKEALAVNVSALNFGALIVILGSALASFERFDMTWPLVIAGVLLVPTALVYAQLTAAMPRSGGDYVFVGRILSPAMGAATGFALLVFFAYGFGFSATFLGSTLLPASLQALGDVFHTSAIADASSSVSTHFGQFWTGLIVLVLAAAIGLRGVRALARGQLICVVIGTIATLAWVLNLWLHGRGAFVHAFNAAAHGPGAYSAVVGAAHAGGWRTGTTVSGTIGVLPWAVELYLGYTFVVYPAGEVKSPGRTVLRASLIGLALAAAIYLVAWLGLKHLVGLDFAQASSWLGANNPAGAARLTGVPLTANGFAFLVMSDPVSKLLLGLVGVWVLALELMAVLVVSRMLLALSFDRMLPRGLTTVSPKSNSPVIAVTVGFALMVMFMISGIYTGFSTAFRNNILIICGVCLLSSAAAVVMPWRRRDLYAASPKPFGSSWFGVPPVTIAGIASATVWIVILWLTATRPMLSNGYSWVSIATLAVAAFGGIVLFIGSRLYLRRQGTDVGLAMRELPPD
jgi:APA family basic amino acid/polyamine antiporter